MADLPADMILLRVCIPTGLMVCGTEMSRVISSVAIVLVCTGMLFALTVPLTVHVKRGKNGISKPNAGDALQPLSIPSRGMIRNTPLSLFYIARMR